MNRLIKGASDNNGFYIRYAFCEKGNKLEEYSMIIYLLTRGFHGDKSFPSISEAVKIFLCGTVLYFILLAIAAIIISTISNGVAQAAIWLLFPVVVLKLPCANLGLMFYEKYFRKTVLKWHGCEHKTIAVLEKNWPSQSTAPLINLSAIKKSSRLATGCSSAKEIKNTLVLLTLAFSLPILCILLGVLSGLLLALNLCWLAWLIEKTDAYNKFLQRYFTTMEPDKNQLKSALHAAIFLQLWFIIVSEYYRKTDKYPCEKAVFVLKDDGNVESVIVTEQDEVTTLSDLMVSIEKVLSDKTN
jgi:hypothetical protein